MKKDMRNLTLIFTVCAGALLFTGCAKVKTALIDMGINTPSQNVMETPHATLDGRTIRFGDETKDTFGPSFDFDKLR